VTLVANMVETGVTPLLTADELADLGFRWWCRPCRGLFAAVQAMT
jgi:2-methylisocitrate lyase-like PEP mutase family enzyme